MDGNQAVRKLGAAGASPDTATGVGTDAQPMQMTGRGAQFVYAAATVANIVCTNLTQQQVNLLGNFLTVLTASVFAILTVENPSDIIED